MGSAGCQDYLFEQKVPTEVKEAEIVVPELTPTPADILFVVDNSASMKDEQELLARNFDRFIQAVAGDFDLRLAVVTTDLVTDGPDGGERDGDYFPDFANNFPNQLVINTAPTCAAITPEIPHGCFRGPNPDTRVVTSDMPRDQQVATFRTNVVVGECGAGLEQGLAAAVKALQRAEAGTCNQGFLRSNANLVVIFVSDEDDQSDGAISAWVDALGTLKSFGSIRVGVIAGVDGNAAANCHPSRGAQCGDAACTGRPAQLGSEQACTSRGDCDPGESCNDDIGGICTEPEWAKWTDVQCAHCSLFNTDDCCSAVAGRRYVDFALAMEARIADANGAIQASQCQPQAGARTACLIDSICQEDFGDTLTRIAEELVITNEFSLDPPAIYPRGVRVRVSGGRFGDGEELVYDEHFTVVDGGRRLVFLDDSKVPVEGEGIEIYFVVNASVGTP